MTRPTNPNPAGGQQARKLRLRPGRATCQGIDDSGPIPFNELPGGGSSPIVIIHSRAVGGGGRGAKHPGRAQFSIERREAFGERPVHDGTGLPQAAALGFVGCNADKMSLNGDARAA